MSKITDTVTKLAEPVAKSCGCELWDVEYLREAGQNYLRVYIDREGGVDIDTCEAFSRALDPLLDEADPIPDPYVFEVSSAGAERELKRPSDYERFLGSFVAVRLYSARGARKEFTGTLTAYRDGNIEIEEENGEKLCFSEKEVAQTRLRIKF